jgi:hypothetical protein
MLRLTVSQYTNCLLPEDDNTDSVTIHQLFTDIVKTDSVTIRKLFTDIVKTDSVTIHKLPSAWRCQDWQCHNTQTVKRSFLRNHMLVHHNYMVTPAPVAGLKACHNSTAVVSVLQTLWSIPRGHCSRDHLFINPLLPLYCELFNGDIQLGTVSYCNYSTSDYRAIDIVTELAKLCPLWRMGFIFAGTSRSPLVLNQPPVLCLPAAFPWVRRLEREANHLFPV